VNRKLFLSKEQLISLYVDQEMTAHAIASVYGVNDSTITYHLKKNGIQVRNKQFEFETNQQIKLTPQQREVLVGIILGDGCLSPTRSGRLATLIVGHSVKQEEYIKIQAHMFDVNKISPSKCFNKTTQKEYRGLYFKTKSTTDLLDLYHVFYPQGKKIVPDNISSLLSSPISLAYWIMDDGCFNKYDKRLSICTDCFSYEYHQKLVSAISNNFQIDAKICRYGKYFRLRFGQKDTRKASDLIRPYVIESMRYKLTPQTILSESTNIPI
jgi:LAGLIDADG DNA endonuclease family